MRERAAYTSRVTTPAQRRAHRALLISGALTVLTIAGHTAGRGSLPDVVGLGAVAGLSFGLAFATSARRLGAERLLGFLLAAQAFLHLVLTFSSPHAHGGTSAVMDAPAMIMGHVIAAILAAGLITHADALIDRWLAFLGAVLGTPAPGAALLPRGTARPTPAPAPSSRLRDSLLRDETRRGPPSVLRLA